ncbi:hypothetical protein [Kitasatospora sp. DSM 101779]|uniref:hypothetical protein n=1 Tax=Kitasatospora sp. DSM 101779 TaxID=2853165 RepID=UPI0021D99D58|nr:hypothetical protein [Kitasatospora sp. DSM 101779]MCU7826359.1 hypothetical protein [Kitasatospora sp. DSM 101779]
MSTFRVACTVAVWLVVFVQAVPALVRDRAPRWFGHRVASPRLWAVGTVVTAVGCTLGLLTPVWWPGPLAVLLGLGITEWGSRVGRGRA